MDLLPTPEQLEIAAAASNLLTKELPIARLQQLRAEPTSIDRRVWSHCAELGWFGLGLPEADGGVGYGLAEEALLFCEIGRHLAPGPFLGTTLGARVAIAGGRADIAAGAMAGDAVVAMAEPRQPLQHDTVIGERVSGSFDVLDPVGASHIVVVTPTASAVVSLEDVQPVDILPSIDPGVRLGRVQLDAVPAAALLAAAGAPGDLFVRGSVLAAAMLVGISEATRDMAAEFAKVRVQFGKPIGVNQAIKHRCADMAMRAEAARSLVLFAALSVDEERPDAAFQAAAAKVVATDAGIRNAAENIQVHGGMGYTFEHPAHLYLKRAHVMDRVMGASRDHLARLLAMPAAQ
jgi:alkylation response protein AidB-like acyl-CoA dehydrogenase